MNDAAPQAAHATCDFIEVTDQAEWDRLTAEAALYAFVEDRVIAEMFDEEPDDAEPA